MIMNSHKKLSSKQIADIEMLDKETVQKVECAIEEMKKQSDVEMQMLEEIAADENFERAIQEIEEQYANELQQMKELDDKKLQ